MTSHYTWGSITTLHDFKGVLGRPLDTFFWALTTPMVTAPSSCVKWPTVSLTLCIALSGVDHRMWKEVCYKACLDVYTLHCGTRTHLFMLATLVKMGVLSMLFATITFFFRRWSFVRIPCMSKTCVITTNRMLIAISSYVASRNLVISTRPMVHLHVGI